MNGEVSDDTLCAYLDDELEPAERSEVERAIAENAELRARLEALRRADAALTTAFDPAILGPTPDRLRDIVEKGPGPATVLPFRRRGLPALSNEVWRLPVAAAMALAVGVASFAAGRLTTGGEPVLVAILESDRTLGAALDRTPSAEARRFGTADLTPVASFRSADGRFCREFEIAGTDGGATGVACRNADGWTVEALVAAEPEGPGYRTVNGPTTAIDAVIEGLGGAGALSAEEEAAAMSGGWRR
jgi:hypothetical protein